MVCMSWWYRPSGANSRFTRGWANSTLSSEPKITSSPQRFPILLQRLNTLQLLHDDLEWTDTLVIRGPKTLPVGFTAV
jgi:hypothetical protein